MAVIFRRCSGVCCLGWAIRPPSGLSLIGSAAWFGRYCTRGCDLSSKAANRIPGQEETRSDAGASASQARLRSRNHTHKPGYRYKRTANVAVDFRRSAMACGCYMALSQAQTPSAKQPDRAFAPIMGLHPIAIELAATRKTVTSISPINRAFRSLLLACEGEPVAPMKLPVLYVTGDRTNPRTIYS
jgi:hypothetical protein